MEFRGNFLMKHMERGGILTTSLMVKLPKALRLLKVLPEINAKRVMEQEIVLPKVHQGERMPVLAVAYADIVVVQDG